MQIPAYLVAIVLFLLLLAASVWGVRSCSGQQEAEKAASELRLEKKLDSLALLNRALISEKDVSTLKEQNAEANRKALADEANRANRDNQTTLLVAMMNRPNQDLLALRGLIENGFLSRDRYTDTSTVIRNDSSYTAAVAIQGKVLNDTRQEIKQMGVVLHQTNERVSGLELILNKRDQGISNTMDYLDERIDERGIFRGKSKKQFKEAKRQLKAVREIK